MYDRFEINSFDYGSYAASYTNAEFLISGPYTPLRPPVQNNTSITSLLPVEGIDIPFNVSNGRLIFDDEWYGWTAQIYQESGTINGTFMDSYIGNKLYVSNRVNYSILDGGYVDLSINGDIKVSPGVVLYKGEQYKFCGIQWALSDQIWTLPMNRGVCFSIFICGSKTESGNNMLIETVETDLIINQVGDYSTLYAVIKSLYSVDYSDLAYIELYRGQFFSQSPSTPYMKGHVDSRYRSPVLDNYSIYH